MGMKLPYVNFHNKRWVDVEALKELLREVAGNPDKVVVDLEKLADWLDEAEYEEPRQS